MTKTLWALSDIHVSYPENKALISEFVPASDDDWMIIAGDVSENFDEVEEALSLFTSRFAKVIFTPGNHDLWVSDEGAADELRGVARYEKLVEIARRCGAFTPEDEYQVWESDEGPVTVAPVFVQYDYSFRPRDGADEIPLRDELRLPTDPYASMPEWCNARVANTEPRLAEAAATGNQLVLVNHYPTVQAPVDAVRLQGIAPWCGTEQTADWHQRFNARAMVYGHLHIPAHRVIDGTEFFEVSVGRPDEWGTRETRPAPVKILGGA